MSSDTPIVLQDVSYFSQLFRRHSGVTPLRYREAVRGKLFLPKAVASAGDTAVVDR